MCDDVRLRSSQDLLASLYSLQQAEDLSVDTVVVGEAGALVRVHWAVVAGGGGWRVQSEAYNYFPNK